MKGKSTNVKSFRLGWNTNEVRKRSLHIPYDKDDDDKHTQLLMIMNEETFVTVL